MASRTFTAEECHRINSDASHNIRRRGIAAPNAFGPPRTFNIEYPISKNEVARESREYTRKKFQEKKIIRVNSRYSRADLLSSLCVRFLIDEPAITDAGYSSIRVIRVIRGSPTLFLIRRHFWQHRRLQDMRFFRRQVTVEASCLRLSAYVDAQRLA
jgi:hypothetical protein